MLKKNLKLFLKTIDLLILLSHLWQETFPHVIHMSVLTARVANTKTNCGETLEDALAKNSSVPTNDSSVGEAACEIIKLTKPQIASVAFNCS